MTHRPKGRSIVAGALCLGLAGCPALINDDWEIVPEGGAPAHDGGVDRVVAKDGSADHVTEGGEALDSARDEGGDLDATSDSTEDAADDGISTFDSIAPVDATPDAGCLGWALGGIGVPAGTVASATSTYTTYSLTITFPTSTTFNGIRVAAAATATPYETYTIFGSDGTTVIGSASVNPVNGQPPTYSILPAIPVTPGAYSSIAISVNGMASWVHQRDLAAHHRVSVGDRRARTDVRAVAAMRRGI